MVKTVTKRHDDNDNSMSIIMIKMNHFYKCFMFLRCLYSFISDYFYYCFFVFC